MPGARCPGTSRPGARPPEVSAAPPGCPERGPGRLPVSAASRSRGLPVPGPSGTGRSRSSFRARCPY
ncbi:hypothetical protein SGL43_03315 [Streptomyces globisporus]|uniref:Uncharacterized protein n=1 Tax=Streptomyces globisporus TaxID=1908 RepID=A0ABM9GXH1_STRGL|nr:hypothetical protein SGL43_03315 [Streptomyces globisporus]